jgi:TusA-related sulfurtransferase
MKQIDARGLSCPQPVIMARKGIAEMGSGKLEALVDSVTSRDNVIRAARLEGCDTEVFAKGDEFTVIISKK